MLSKKFTVNQILNDGKKQFAKLVENLQKMKNIRSITSPSVRTDFTGFVKTNKVNQNETITSFGILCLNPSYIFRRLIEEEKPHSVILTSGTLTP